MKIQEASEDITIWELRPKENLEEERTQIQQFDVAQVTQLNKVTTQTMCPVLQMDFNLIRHLLAMETNEANVPLAPYLVKKHKMSSIGRLVFKVNPRWLKDIIFQLGCFSSLIFFVSFFKLLIFFILTVLVWRFSNCNWS